MSRDIFYLAPSESDGGSEQQQPQQQPQQQQAATNDRVNVERQPAYVDEAMSQSIKERVYYAAKDGLPLALQSLLSNEKSDATKNAYINQVRQHFFFEIILICDHIYVLCPMNGFGWKSI